MAAVKQDARARGNVNESVLYMRNECTNLVTGLRALLPMVADFGSGRRLAGVAPGT